MPGAILERYRAGIRRQLVCLPTGTGKTVIFAAFPAFFRMKKRMLVLAHREELLDQARDKLMAGNPDLHVAVEQAGRTADASADVVVGSVATLGRRGSRRLQRLDPEDFYLLVVDEAHHATAATYRRVLDHFGVFESGTERLLVGFTATPKRGDNQGLDAVFEEIVFSRALPEMIDAGYLSPIAAYRVETAVDLSGVRTRLGDFVAGQLSDAVNVAERNEIVIDVLKRHLGGRKTLVFCVDVAHAHDLAAAFEADGIRTGAITGELPGDERRALLAAFASGEKQVLTNCMVLTEGYDEPSVEGIILARPTQSALLYTQMIGRGTRLHPGKHDVIVIDIVDVSRGHRLITLPSLFGLRGSFDLEGKTTAYVQRAFDWVRRHRPWVPTDSVSSLSELRYRCQRIDLFDLQSPGELDYFAELMWLRAGEETYQLPLGHGETVTVSPTILGRWEAIWSAPGAASVTFAVAANLEQAVVTVERWVRQERAEALKLVQPQARWRQQAPSPRQQAFIQRHGLTVPAGMTKGQASQLIAMLAAAPRQVQPCRGSPTRTD